VTKNLAVLKKSKGHVEKIKRRQKEMKKKAFCLGAACVALPFFVSGKRCFLPFQRF